MRYIKCIGYLACLVCTYVQSLAQTNFAQVTQTPLLLNSSLAGSMKAKRIATAYNGLDGNDKRFTNLYASYDDHSKLLRSGIGGYYAYELSKSKAIDANFKQELRARLASQDFENQARTHRIGLSFAPKYVFKKGNKTFSPSIFMEYGQTEQKQAFGFKHTTLGLMPSDTFYHEANTIRYYKGNTTIRQFHTGFGFAVNTKHWVLLCKTFYSIESGHEYLEKIDIQRFDNTLKTRMKLFVDEFYALSQQVQMGYSFPKNTNASWSLTPMLGLGAKQYLNAGKLASDTSTIDAVYGQYQSSKKAGEINYIHASTNFRVDKFITGFAFTKSNDQAFYGFNLGYQTDAYRLIANCMWRERRIALEMSLSFFLKQH